MWIIIHHGKEIFVGTQKELRKIIGDYVLDIQHVGSTSIIGIKAKPILDIAILIKQEYDI